MNKNALARVVLLACMAVPLPAAAEDECGPVMNKCAADEYGVSFPKDRCADGTGEKCLAWNEAPTPVLLECYPLYSSGLRCHAWPRPADGEDPLYYRWEAGGQVYAGSTAQTTSHIRDVSCLSTSPGAMGFVSVTVTSPFGLASSTSIGVECGSQAN